MYSSSCRCCTVKYPSCFASLSLFCYRGRGISFHPDSSCAGKQCSCWRQIVACTSVRTWASHLTDFNTILVISIGGRPILRRYTFFPVSHDSFISCSTSLERVLGTGWLQYSVSSYDAELRSVYLVRRFGAVIVPAAFRGSCHVKMTDCSHVHDQILSLPHNLSILDTFIRATEQENVALDETTCWHLRLSLLRVIRNMFENLRVLLALADSVHRT